MTGLRAAVSNTIFFRNSQGATVRGLLLKINRNTIVLEVYNPYSIVQLSEVLSELKVLRGDKVIYNGKAVVNNLLNTGLMLIVSATLVDPWKDLTGLEDPDKINVEIHHFIDDWEKSCTIIPGYQLVVGQIRSFLSEFHRWLEQFDVEDYNKALLADLYKILFPPMQAKLAELFIKFEQEVSKVPTESLNAHKAFSQSNIHPLILRAPFVYRTFYKPLGYAGDYEMVNMILRDPREGENLYTQLINSFFLETTTSLAHRNRINILVDTIETVATKANEKYGQFKAFNIACGPAVEIQRFTGTPTNLNCKLDLLDFNQETLAFTKKEIESIMVHKNNIAINYIFKSVHELLKDSVRLEDSEYSNQYDLVYCAGLFDYLSDKVCSKLIKLFYHWVKPGGIVLVTNVHPSSDNKGIMEHIAEWYLIYRDESHMISLLDKSMNHKFYSDETGANIFLEIQKPDE